MSMQSESNLTQSSRPSSDDYIAGHVNGLSEIIPVQPQLAQVPAIVALDAINDPPAA